MRRWLWLILLIGWCVMPLQPVRAQTRDPQDWMNWPVVPEITPRARQIYAQGMALGNNPHHLTKIGDCQGILEVLMGVYDIPGSYRLAPNEQNLQETIDYFRGSFYRNGYALKGGFDAPAVFDPTRADPDWCLPGETPLECEFRIYRPAFVLITLEYTYPGRDAENYTAYIRRIVEFAIAHGTVPILSTKADNVENDHSINLASARLAVEYDLPLWNFWRSVQYLPNHGLDSSAGRNDGFHISYAAWSVRSKTALRTLDSLWRGVRDLTPPEPAPSARPAPGPYAGQLVFSLLRRGPGGEIADGVYRFDPESQNLQQILPSGYQLQAVAPDGRSLLVNQGGVLWLVDLDGKPQVQLSETFAGQRGAFFLPDGRTLLVLDRRTADLAVWQVSLPDLAWTRLTSPDHQPLVLYPGGDGRTVTWGEGRCAGFDACSISSLWTLDLQDGGVSRLSAQARRPVFASDGQHLAYAYAGASAADGLTWLGLTIEDAARQTLWNFRLDEAHAMAYDWTPDSRFVLAAFQGRNSFSGSPSPVRVVRLRVLDELTFEYSSAAGVFPQLAVSADGAQTALTTTQLRQGGYAVYLRWFRTDGNGLYQDALLFQNSDFVTLTSLTWLP
jgi:hypothetical protein